MWIRPCNCNWVVKPVVFHYLTKHVNVIVPHCPKYYSWQHLCPYTLVHTCCSPGFVVCYNLQILTSSIWSLLGSFAHGTALYKSYPYNQRLTLSCGQSYNLIGYAPFCSEQSLNLCDFTKPLIFLWITVGIEMGTGYKMPIHYTYKVYTHACTHTNTCTSAFTHTACTHTCV